MNYLNKIPAPLQWLLIVISFFIVAWAGNSILGYLLAVLLFIWSILNPKQAVLLMIIFTPLRPYLIEYNSSLKLIGDVLIFGALLHVIWMSRKEIKSLLKFHWFEIGYLGFIFIGVLSALITGVDFGAIIFQVRAFILFYLVYYVVKRLNITKEDVQQAFWAMFWTTVVILIHALVEKFSIRSLLLPQAWMEMALSAKNRVRIYGLVGNPNELAIFTGFSFMFFYYFKRFYQLAPNYLINIVLYLNVAVFILTYSRGTWIGFGISAIVYIILTKNKKFGLDLFKYFAIAGLFFVLPINLITNYIESTSYGTGKIQEIQQFDIEGKSGFIDRIGTTFSPDTLEGSQETGRLFIVQRGLDIVYDSPILGTGFGTYGDSATLSYGSPIYDKYDINFKFFSDNQYIQVITQTGVIGVLLFAVFLLSMLVVSYKNRNVSKKYIFITSILLGAFFMGLVYNLWESDVFTFMFFLYLGITYLKKPLNLY